MIYSLKGLVAHMEPNIAIIECNDIGFKCNVSSNTAAKIKVNDKCRLYTYMHVKEDSLGLFGFYDEDELKCFKILINISGVGPKAAISILSQFTPQSLSIAISANDSATISKTPGIGPKTAQRIILELKDKLTYQISPKSDNISSVDINSEVHYIKNNSVFNEALEALKSLGYSESDVLKVINKYDSHLTIEEIIKQALRDL